MLCISTCKSAQSTSICDPSQLHSPASRQSPKSNTATAASLPQQPKLEGLQYAGLQHLTRACQARDERPGTVFMDQVAQSTHVCGPRPLHTLSRSHYQGHESPTQDFYQSQGVVTLHTKNITAHAVVTHQCQYKKRFRKARRFELNSCRNLN